MFRAGLFHCVAAAIAAAAHAGQSAHRRLWPLCSMTPPQLPWLEPDDPLPLPAAACGPHDPPPGPFPPPPPPPHPSPRPPPRPPGLGPPDPPPLRAAGWGPNAPAPGLLAAGGALSIAYLCAAYGQGCFPWYGPGQPILWWTPDPRM